MSGINTITNPCEWFIREHIFRGRFRTGTIHVRIPVNLASGLPFPKAPYQCMRQIVMVMAHSGTCVMRVQNTKLHSVLRRIFERQCIREIRVYVNTLYLRMVSEKRRQCGTGLYHGFALRYHDAEYTPSHGKDLILESQFVRIMIA